MRFKERLEQQKETTEAPTRRQCEAELRRISQVEEVVREQTERNRVILQKYRVNECLSVYRNIAWNGHGTVSPVERRSSIPGVQELELIGFELYGYKLIEAQLLIGQLSITMDTGSKRTGDYSPGGMSYISGWHPDNRFGELTTGKMAERSAISVVVKSTNSELEVNANSSVGLEENQYLIELAARKDPYSRDSYKKLSPLNYHPYDSYSRAVGDIEDLENFLSSDFQRRLDDRKIPDFSSVEELQWSAFHTKHTFTSFKPNK